ncbi:hypothetical protein LBY41_004465 [Vibrio vulnificus]|uniref:hypothetical protein n=1 Tax=Vibrio vulnificus TaxID=672 RepID=UPI000A2064FC|nr:hypothetical protein [Vibrio vulnificus]ARN66116.1 hypothetical protein FORC36_1599 [Vibrio vulnificus]EID4426141.1 hypothetical protein [Vibrio vulnificus]
MDDISVNLVLGVVAGLITTIVLFICRAIAYDVVMPWLRKSTYQGINIDGTWYRRTRSQRAVIELKQDTNIIKGKATVIVNDESKPPAHQDGSCLDDIRTFDIEGKISNGFVHLVMWHTNKQRLGLHTYLLKVTADGTKLSGKSSWYAPLADIINSGNTDLYRSDALAIKALEQSEGPTKPKS